MSSDIIKVLAIALSALVLTPSVRGQPGFFAARVAFGCIVATQAVFWCATYPVNVATQNWTTLPEHWEALPARWEYSHAFSAVLNLAALFASINAVLA